MTVVPTPEQSLVESIREMVDFTNEGKLWLSVEDLRNLLDRVQAAESALLELKPADVLVEGSWFAVADLPEILGNHMVFADKCARDAKAAHLRAEAAEAKAAAVRELHSRTYESVDNEVWGRDPRCSECRYSYPCPTITILDGAA